MGSTYIHEEMDLFIRVVLQIRFITLAYRDFIGKKDDESLSPQKRTHSLNSQNSSSE